MIRCLYNRCHQINTLGSISIQRGNNRDCVMKIKNKDYQIIVGEDILLLPMEKIKSGMDIISVQSYLPKHTENKGIRNNPHQPVHQTSLLFRSTKIIIS